MNRPRIPADEDLRITTGRLFIRPPADGDEEAIVSICNHEDVHANTLTIPFPYTRSDAADWIRRSTDSRREGVGYAFLVAHREDRTPIGTTGLSVDRDHARAEVGYVVAPEHRGAGIATEATRAMLHFGFESLALERITAAWFPHNPASESILLKVGMTHEGTLRRHYRKGDRFLDVNTMAILRSEFEQSR